MSNIDPKHLQSRLLHRANDSHKGDYGHLLIVAGCQTMPGAAVLATGAALKSGCGLVTLHSTERALQAALNSFPSAMLSEDPEEHFSAMPAKGVTRYSAIAVGPGLGRSPETGAALRQLLSACREHGIPMVLDADALNWIGENKDWISLIPKGSVFTPHLGELGRMFSWDTEEGKEASICELCFRTESALVLKGYRSKVFTPTGECLENSTGNPGMAKGGSGDVLTGLVGGLLARGYCAEDAAALGVWIHGYAGDVLTKECTAEGYNSRDLIDRLHLGFKKLYNNSV